MAIPYIQLIEDATDASRRENVHRLIKAGHSRKIACVVAYKKQAKIIKRQGSQIASTPDKEK